MILVSQFELEDILDSTSPLFFNLISFPSAFLKLMKTLLGEQPM